MVPRDQCNWRLKMAATENFIMISSTVQEGDVDYDSPLSLCFCGHVAPSWVS